MKPSRRRCFECRELYPQSWMMRDLGRWVCFPACGQNSTKARRMAGEPKPREGRVDISLMYNPNPNSDWSG